jgi:hypothetical protein
MKPVFRARPSVVVPSVLAFIFAIMVAPGASHASTGGSVSLMTQAMPASSVLLSEQEYHGALANAYERGAEEGYQPTPFTGDPVLVYTFEQQPDRIEAGCDKKLTTVGLRGSSVVSVWGSYLFKTTERPDGSLDIRFNNRSQVVYGFYFYVRGVGKDDMTAQVIEVRDPRTLGAYEDNLRVPPADDWVYACVGY